MNTIIIKPKSKANYDLLISLVKSLGEKMNIISDKVLSEALFAAEIEESVKEGILNKTQKASFLKEIKLKATSQSAKKE
jgi:hypothetical protein